MIFFTKPLKKDYIMKNNEKNYYSQDYWFDNEGEHHEEDNYGENYYANTIFNNLILELDDIPEEGYIVVLGTNKCVSFNLLCDKFGEERCIGYDIYNPDNHPRVVVKDCMTLGEEDNIPIAFCHNDIGSYPTTPELKVYAQKWAAKNVVEGGYFLGRNNLNRAKFKAEEYMNSLGFDNFQFEDLKKEYNLSGLTDSSIEGHMLSKRSKITG